MQPRAPMSAHTAAGAPAAGMAVDRLADTSAPTTPPPRYR